MADYWKSTGKWYCELCKCWTGDNKASREFHERGKRHAEAKKRKIIEAKRDAIGKRKQDEKDTRMFAKMEKDALAAVQKDLATGSVGRGDMKKIAAAQSGSQDESTGIDTYPWKAMDTPQGFTYYYNSQTGESTWIVPAVFKKIEEEKKKKENDAAVLAASKSTPTITPPTNHTDTEDKQTAQHDVHPLLGGWSTVTHHSQPTQPVIDEEDQSYQKADGSVDAEAPSSSTSKVEGVESATTGEAVEAPPRRESGKKFKEKVLSSSLSISTTTDSEPVTFKKRKSGNKNVRRRTDDD